MVQSLSPTHLSAIRFPSGMKNVTAALHSLGLKFGLYTDVGRTTCRGGRLGSWPHYADDAETFSDWGIDWVKMDWYSKE